MIVFRNIFYVEYSRGYLIYEMFFFSPENFPKCHLSVVWF